MKWGNCLSKNKRLLDGNEKQCSHKDKQNGKSERMDTEGRSQSIIFKSVQFSRRCAQKVILY
jgi:hypothetical protein